MSTNSRNTGELQISDLSSLPVCHQATIGDDYRDEMGHMNVMWYTHLFDRSVYGICQHIGLTLDHMRDENAGSFALETHIRYLSEVRIGNRVRIHCRVVGRSGKRYHLIQFMVNESKDDLAATFEVIGAYIDMSQRRMGEMPPEIAVKFDELIADHSRLRWQPPLCGTMNP